MSRHLRDQDATQADAPALLLTQSSEWSDLELFRVTVEFTRRHGYPTAVTTVLPSGSMITLANETDRYRGAVAL